MKCIVCGLHSAYGVLILLCVASFAFGYEADSLLRSPFQENYRIYAVFGQKEMDLQVEAVLNNKALIHNKWYRVGDKIGTFYLQHIRSDEIVLIDKKMEQKIIKLKKGNLR